MYKPKDSMRWKPKFVFPLRLDDQCLDVLYTMLTTAAFKLTNERNTREKKALREFISANIPLSLQQRMLQRPVDKLVGVQTTLNILDMFEPSIVAKRSVDLLGSFRLGFGCYVKGGRLTWSQGSAKKFNLTTNQLEQLYNILLWSKPSGLEELSLSISRNAIQSSKLPNILAQAKSLTKVTILSGAENHTLRILGLNCPCLVSLDVSHSIKVTDQGLRNLFLKHRFRKRASRDAIPGSVYDANNETNPCSSSISSIMLVGTSVTWAGCDYACKLMNFGYLTASLPFVRILRINNAELCYKGLPIERQKLNLISSPLISDQIKEIALTSAHNTLLPEELTDTVMDFFTANDPKHPEASNTLIFLRENQDSFKIHVHLKVESSFVTSLILPWYTFTWRVDGLVELETLGTFFPNLRFLKGRIKGRWNRVDEPLLPHLQSAYVWSLNSTTVLSMLENIPFMTFLEFNNTRTVSVENPHWELTDRTLETALIFNSSLAQSLETFTIRPCELTRNSLKTLTTKCRNLKRIGDLESWNVTSEDIGNFNAYLDGVRSPCVLTIMNFPPTSEATMMDQWKF